MEVYRRIVERVRGALWAHHRRLMSERQFHRILAYVYNNKYEHQIRFDQMTVVGREWDGRVEVVTTPAGFLKKVRVNPAVTELSAPQQTALILSAYAAACKEGHALMERAEMNIYKQFLKDLKPIILSIRDNPEFYTVPEKWGQSMAGTLQGSQRDAIAAGTPQGQTERNDGTLVHRTIPISTAYQPTDAVRQRRMWEQRWLQSPQGQQWARTLKGKEYLAKHAAEYRPRGAPGAKKRTLPLDLPVPYMAMDEARLLRKNWMVYLDNKHVAESLWTRSQIGAREKQLRHMQERGEAWHRPVFDKQPTS